VGEAAPTRDEPSVTASFKQGWSALWDYFAILLVVWIVTLVLNGPSNAANLGRFAGVGEGTLFTLSVIGGAWGALVGIPLNFGNAFVNLEVSRNGDPELSDLLEGFRQYVSALGSAILVGIAIFAGLLLLIVPGIWAALRLSFTPFMVVDRKLGAIDAVKASWNATSGHALQILGFAILAFFVLVAGLLLLIVGVIPAGMWVGVSFADLYDDVAGPPPSTRPTPTDTALSEPA